MEKILTAASRLTGEAVPAVGLNFSAGKYAAFGSNMSITKDAVYHIVATVPCFITTGATPGGAAGSTYLAAGMPMHLIFRKGQSIKSVAADGTTPGGIFAVPLATE